MELKFYKIVQTIEDGKPFLAAVPGKWEANGKLMWPPKQKKDKALRRPLDPPGTIVEGWTQHNCILKRSFIPSYADALKEISTMSDMSDTTDVENSPLTSRKRTAAGRKTKSLLKNADIQRSNFNEYQEQSEPMDTMEPNTNNQIEQFIDENSIEHEDNNGAEHQEIYAVDGLKGEIDLTTMVFSLVQAVAKMQSRLDRCIALEEEILQKCTSGIQVNKDKRHEVDFEPINNIKELIDFEAKLAKKDFFENMFRKLCSICGPKSGHYGDSVSYRIVDSLFTRKLFTLVSWSGGSRIKQNENFSRFVNTFQFFFGLVSNCDPNYTESDLKGFFQKIINNSKRRFENALSDTPKRVSSTKHHTIKPFNQKAVKTKLSDESSKEEENEEEAENEEFIESEEGESPNIDVLYA